MNKELLYNLKLQAGGSHYPSINSDLQEKFAELIIKECFAAIDQAVAGLDDPGEKIGAEYAAYSISKRFHVN